MRANDLILGVQEKAKCIMHKYARKAAAPKPPGAFLARRERRGWHWIGSGN